MTRVTDVMINGAGAGYPGVRNLVDSHQDETAQSAVWDGTGGVCSSRLESDGAVEIRRHSENATSHRS